MTCCEGWTSCNGFSLLILLVIGIILNAIPLGISLIEEGPISCYEWWFPGIIGAGVMVLPATAMTLASRKRACCNNRMGMLLSSLLNAITIIGAVYCLLVSLLALAEGPLVCSPESSHPNSTIACEFSFKNLSAFQPETFNLQWFFNDTCVPPRSVESPANYVFGYWSTFSPDNEVNRLRTFHLAVFLGLLLVAILELLFGLSQIVIGLLGCLCGVSRQRGQIV